MLLMTDLLSRPVERQAPVINGLEVRDIAGAIRTKDVTDANHTVLVEFPHDRVDTYTTTFGERAFADSFQQRMPVMCWQHDLRDPIGHAIKAQALRHANEVVGKFDDFESVPNARRAFTQIRSGTITDFSFGFRDAKSRPTSRHGQGVRQIISATMVEFSPVSRGSIPGAKVVGIREEGTAAVLDINHLIALREHGMLDEEGFRATLAEHFPELAGRIIIPNTVTGGSTRADTEPGSGAAAPADADSDHADPIEWTALKSGGSTATGPNDEALRVRPGKDADGGDIHRWTVHDADGNEVERGEEGDEDSARKAAEDSVRSDRRSVQRYLTTDGFLHANGVRALIEETCPDMALMLRDADLTIRPAGTDTGGTREEDAATLASATDAALDSAAQWLEGVDISKLPDPVQQAIALMQAAGTAVDGLLDVMGIDDPDDDDGDGDGDLGTRADVKMSEKPWGDFSQSDYSDSQWKDACLIDTGSGNTAKERYSLPVKEPNGEYNRHGIAAAAGRLNETHAPEEAKVAAAKKLMSLYHSMGDKVPGDVLKVAGAGSRSPEEVAADIAAAQAKLDRHLSRRTPAA